MFTNFTSHSKRKAYQKFIARFMLQCYLITYCLLAKCISHKLHNETYPISNKSYLFFDIIQLPNSDSDKVFRVLYISYKVLRDCICIKSQIQGVILDKCLYHEKFKKYIIWNCTTLKIFYILFH